MLLPCTLICREVEAHLDVILSESGVQKDAVKARRQGQTTHFGCENLLLGQRLCCKLLGTLHLVQNVWLCEWGVSEIEVR